MQRRSFLKAIGFSIPAAAAIPSLSAFGTGKKQSVRIVQFDAAGVRTGVTELEKVEKTDAEWRKQLNSQQYEITRQAGTEVPGTGKYANNHSDGLYHCICCDTVLFDATEKFESGTGWPSFTQPIAPAVIAYRFDGPAFLQRVETVCNTCDAHLGHVFPDGPPPSGLRYCMNAVALKKASKDGLA